MRQILRFEDPKGGGPCLGGTGHRTPAGGYPTFFSRYLSPMKSVHVIPEFVQGRHKCAIVPESFDQWGHKKALEVATKEGYLLCVYTVKHAFVDPSEGQACFDPADVVEVIKIAPSSFDREKHLTLFDKIEEKGRGN